MKFNYRSKKERPFKSLEAGDCFEIDGAFYICYGQDNVLELKDYSTEFLDANTQVTHYPDATLAFGEAQ